MDRDDIIHTSFSGTTDIWHFLHTSFSILWRHLPWIEMLFVCLPTCTKRYNNWAYKPRIIETKENKAYQDFKLFEIKSLLSNTSCFFNENDEDLLLFLFFFVYLIVLKYTLHIFIKRREYDISWFDFYFAFIYLSSDDK